MTPKKRGWHGVGAAFVVAALLGGPASPTLVRAERAKPGVVPIDSTHAGLSAQWWRWILGIAAARNPGLDPTGEFCAENQSGPVWFLAGTFVVGAVTRSCTVPDDKSLFFPLLNTGAFPDPGDTVDVLRRLAAGFINTVDNLQARIDGRSVDDLFGYRVLSPVFTLVVPDGGLLGPGVYHSVVSDGYWLLVSPLRPGKHVIHLGGRAPDAVSPFVVDVTYNLTVVEEER